jgi:hypothetical protein
MAKNGFTIAAYPACLRKSLFSLCHYFVMIKIVYLIQVDKELIQSKFDL